MRIGILSDTHKNRELHETVLLELQKLGIAKIYHLGDDYIDSELEIEYGIDVVRIPGLYCPEYRDKSVDTIAFDKIQGVGIVMAHDAKDIPKNDLFCNDIILTGHTHKSEILIENGKLFLNPGHLKSMMDKNRAPSYALLDIDFGEIEATIREVGGKTVLRTRLKKDETGLYKV